MNDPLDFPFVAKDHIATLAALTKEEAGSWITLVAHCWYSGPLTSEFAVRLVGEQQFEQIRFLLEMDKGKFSFLWLETARARKEKRSLQNSKNGKQGGRGNRRGNKGPRPATVISISPQQAPPAPQRAPRTPRPSPLEKTLVLFPQEKFTWPKWAGQKVKKIWQDFKHARWEKHKEQYHSVEAEQNAINLLDNWFKRGDDCYNALVVATAKQWKNLVDPAVLAANSFGGKVPVPDEHGKVGGIDQSKVKSWLQ